MRRSVRRLDESVDRAGTSLGSVKSQKRWYAVDGSLAAHSKPTALVMLRCLVVSGGAAGVAHARFDSSLARCSLRLQGRGPMSVWAGGDDAYVFELLSVVRRYWCNVEGVDGDAKIACGWVRWPWLCSLCKVSLTRVKTETNQKCHRITQATISRIRAGAKSSTFSKPSNTSMPPPQPRRMLTPPVNPATAST